MKALLPAVGPVLILLSALPFPAGRFSGGRIVLPLSFGSFCRAALMLYALAIPMVLHGGVLLLPGGAFGCDASGALFLLAFSAAAISFLCESEAGFLPWTGVCLAAFAQSEESLALTCALTLLAARPQSRADWVTSFLLAASVSVTPVLSVVLLLWGLFRAGAGRAQSAGWPVLLSGLVSLIGVRVFLTGFAGRPPVSQAGVLLAGGSCVVAILLAIMALRANRMSRTVASLTATATALIPGSIGLAVMAREGEMPVTGQAAVSAVAIAVMTILPAAGLVSAAGRIFAFGCDSDLSARLRAMHQSLPDIAIIFGAGLFSLSCLPPGGMFTVFWLHIQVLLTMPSGTALATILPWRLLLAGAGLAAGLGLCGIVRLAGQIYGRSSGEAIRPPARSVPVHVTGALLVPLAVSLVAAFLPGAVLSWQGIPVSGWLSVSAPDGLSSWMPLPVAVAVAVALWGIRWLRLRAGVQRASVQTEWSGGLPARAAATPQTDAVYLALRRMLTDAPVLRFPRPRTRDVRYVRRIASRVLTAISAAADRQVPVLLLIALLAALVILSSGGGTGP
ncbi:hypothetical protein LOC54_09375 [Acetobacter sp. AN02]|uniref:hypothetical protein n=1 Tax=Acetobacter sp. AN02 TaxID=2894186 RepID=UPI0024342C53|nr:hypothetical protein [Acetobacter sp. AN02]MDG6095310.1 hypothetical protein [Acetobacter sp. AN02]